MMHYLLAAGIPPVDGSFMFIRSDGLKKYLLSYANRLAFPSRVVTWEGIGRVSRLRNDMLPNVQIALQNAFHE